MKRSSSRLSLLVAVSLVAVSSAAAVSVGGSALGTGDGGGDLPSGCFSGDDPCTEPIHVRGTAGGQRVEYLGEHHLWYRQGSPSDSGHTWYRVRSDSVLASLDAGVFTFTLRNKDRDTGGTHQLVGRYVSFELTRPGPGHLRVVDGAVVYSGDNILWYRPHNDIGGDASDWERARRWSDDEAITVSVPRGGKHVFHIRDRSSSGYPVLYTAVKNVPPAARRVTTTTTVAPVTPPPPDTSGVDCDALIASDRSPSEWTDAEIGHCTPDGPEPSADPEQDILDDDTPTRAHPFPSFSESPVIVQPLPPLPEVDCDALSNNPSEWTETQQDRCTPDGLGAVPRLSGLTAVYSEERGVVRVSWDKVTRPGKEVRYMVQRKGPGDTGFAIREDLTGDRDNIFIDDFAGAGLKTYHYRVRAVVDGVHGPYADVSVTIPLGAPRNLQVKRQGSDIRISWSPPAGLSSGSVKYVVQRYFSYWETIENDVTGNSAIDGSSYLTMHRGDKVRYRVAVSEINDVDVQGPYATTVTVTKWAAKVDG